MFADAYEIVTQHTWPVIVSARFWNKTVDVGCGAFVILNQEGWIATVAHLWESFFAYQEHSKEIKKHEQAAKEIEQNARLSPKQKRKQLGRLKRNPKWITTLSFWWGRNGITLKDIRRLPKGDLLIGRLEPFDPKWVQTYPAIKDPARGLRPGTCLCKLGYPFYKIESLYNEANDSFVLPEGTLPLPSFPIEGIYTRYILLPRDSSEKFQIKFLETSSPGLKGQSGGPIFDVRGTLWGIQSRTKHFELGFSPTVKKKGKEIEEHQFLNVGWGVHPEVLVEFLRENGIKFTLSEY